MDLGPRLDRFDPRVNQPRKFRAFLPPLAQGIQNLLVGIRLVGDRIYDIHLAVILLFAACRPGPAGRLDEDAQLTRAISDIIL